MSSRWHASWMFLFFAVGPLQSEDDREITGLLHPQLSPDGTMIVASYQGALVTGPAKGGILVRRTMEPGWDIEPTWSPDGSQIAFIKSPNFHSGRLAVLDRNSGDISTFPTLGWASGKLYFSADGNRILGTFRDQQNQYHISWINLSERTRTDLPIGPEDAATFMRKRIKVTLSSDEEALFYAIHRDEPDEQGGNRSPASDVWRSQTDGTNAKLLFTWPARIYDIESLPGDQSLILVTDLGSSHNDLWKVPLAAPLGSAIRLTSSHADDEKPSIDQSGDQLLWSDNFGGDTTLRIRNLESGRDASVAFSGINFGVPTSELTIQIADEHTQEPVSARVSIKSKDGKFFFPKGKLFRLTGPTGHFYMKGECSLRLPRGVYEIRAYRGLEYDVSTQEIDTTESDQSVRLELSRWSHMAKTGWYSGENHVHANYGYGEWYNKPSSILLQCEGEDLNVCNTVIANSDGDAIFDREFFLGQLDPRSSDKHLVFFGQEFRSTIWGHMTLSNLSQLVEPIMTGFPGTTNPNDVPTNADIAQWTSDQGGTIGYTHPAGNLLDLYDQPYSAKGLPIDAAIGRVSLMDIHGHTYDGSIQLWYRLLNTGLRVIGSSGTDVFLNRVRSYPPGWARTYVHLPEGLDYQQWIKRQAEGNSFFTNGPMLTFTINEEEAGSRLSLPAPGSVTVNAHVKSRVPLDRAEIVSNGKVLQAIQLGEDNLSAEFKGEVSIPESGWIALRAHGPSHPDIVKEANAHTNPIWVSVEGHPNSAASKDAEFFLKWIDRLEADLKTRNRIPTDRQWKHVRAQLDGAREYYQSVR